ncbi:MAG: hypothetical protein DVB22_000164 [Verrucomicrobia bacterium]|nr:MAG: hypothetical protein DVB22_000164 [Verrucomicrobiota bacterium]
MSPQINPENPKHNEDFTPNTHTLFPAKTLSLNPHLTSGHSIAMQSHHPLSP